MRVEGTSLIYVDGVNAQEWQEDLRLIVRPLDGGAVFVEMENRSTVAEDISNDDRWNIQCSPAEARDIAASLILAAETAEKKQEATHAEAE